MVIWIRKKKFQSIKKAVVNLIFELNSYNNGQITYPISQLDEILRIIHSNDSKETKEHKIRNIVESLYPSIGGLTDFHVWVEDEKERIRINKPISELNDRLWELVMSN